MNILLTGGAGFIGSHLVRELLGAGHAVYVLDDCSTGSICNIENELGSGRLAVLKADISQYDLSARERTLSGENFHCVVHLAAKASIVPSVKDPLPYFETNVAGTANVLELARNLGIPRFVYAASGSCYGVPAQVPTAEDCPIAPQYPYALTKYLAEQYVLGLCAMYGVAAVSLRLFNVYGRKMNLRGGYGGLFSTILPQAFNGAEVITIGDGEQRRDFVHVADVARAFRLAVESEAAGRMYNIGSGTSVSVNEILQLLGIPHSKVYRLPDRPGEPRETRADISRVCADLGWSPAVQFKDGLADMAADEEYWRSGPVHTRVSSIAAQKDWYAAFGRPLA